MVTVPLLLFSSLLVSQQVLSLTSGASELLEDLHMSCSYFEFVKVRLPFSAAENDDVPTCHSSGLVS